MTDGRRDPEIPASGRIVDAEESLRRYSDPNSLGDLSSDIGAGLLERSAVGSCASTSRMGKVFVMMLSS